MAVSRSDEAKMAVMAEVHERGEVSVTSPALQHFGQATIGAALRAKAKYGWLKLKEQPAHDNKRKIYVKAK